MEKKVQQIAVQIFKTKQEAERGAVEMLKLGFSSAEYYSCARNLALTDCRPMHATPVYYEEQMGKPLWVAMGIR